MYRKKGIQKITLAYLLLGIFLFAQAPWIFHHDHIHRFKCVYSDSKNADYEHSEAHYHAGEEKPCFWCKLTVFKEFQFHHASFPLCLRDAVAFCSVFIPGVSLSAYSISHPRAPPVS